MHCRLGRVGQLVAQESPVLGSSIQFYYLLGSLNLLFGFVEIGYCPVVLGVLTSIGISGEL